MFSTKDLQVYKDGLKKPLVKASEKPTGSPYNLLRSPYTSPRKQPSSIPPLKPPPSPRKDHSILPSTKPPPSPRKEILLISKPPPSPRSRPNPNHEDPSQIMMKEVSRTPLSVVHKGSNVSVKDRHIGRPPNMISKYQGDNGGMRSTPASPKNLPTSPNCGPEDGLFIRTQSLQNPKHHGHDDDDDKHEDEGDSLMSIKVRVKPRRGIESPRSGSVSRPPIEPNASGSVKGSSPTTYSSDRSQCQMNGRYDLRSMTLNIPKRSYSKSPKHGINNLYQRKQSMDSRSSSKGLPVPSASLCIECTRATSEGAVCFIGNDGKVSACTTRVSLRLCKNPNCAAHNPEYLAVMANAPKKYLVSKRHNVLKAQVGPKFQKSHGENDDGNKMVTAAEKEQSSDQFSLISSTTEDFNSNIDDDDDLLNGVNVDYPNGDGDMSFLDGDELGALNLHVAHQNEQGGGEREGEGGTEQDADSSRDIEIDVVNTQAKNVNQAKDGGHGINGNSEFCGPESKDEAMSHDGNGNGNAEISQTCQSDEGGMNGNGEYHGDVELHEGGISNGDGDKISCQDDVDICENVNNGDFIDVAEQDNFNEHPLSHHHTNGSNSKNDKERRRLSTGGKIEMVVQSPETVILRKQETRVGKLSEEWLPNHAIEEVVSKLAPEGPKKVKILVEAFETILISHADVANNAITP